MFEDYRPPSAPMTPDDVLAIFIEWHRCQSWWDPEADPDAVIASDMTIAQWRDACDLIPWQPLGRRLNEYFRTKFTDDDWRAVLTPPGKRRLHEVCALIATRARREVIEPVELMGRPCEGAGAFLAIREILRDAGADVRGLAPSTPLAAYARRHLGAFMRIATLAPGTLPRVFIHTPGYDVFLYGYMAGAALGFISFVAPARWALIALGFALCALSWLGMWITAQHHPAAVQVGNLLTFRDLAMAVVRERTGCFPICPMRPEHRPSMEERDAARRRNRQRNPK